MWTDGDMRKDGNEKVSIKPEILVWIPLAW